MRIWCIKIGIVLVFYKWHYEQSHAFNVLKCKLSPISFKFWKDPNWFYKWFPVQKNF
jgi:hypothetical protein